MRPTKERASHLLQQEGLQCGVQRLADVLQQDRGAGAQPAPAAAPAALRAPPWRAARLQLAPAAQTSVSVLADRIKLRALRLGSAWLSRVRGTCGSMHSGQQRPCVATMALSTDTASCGRPMACHSLT